MPKLDTPKFELLVTVHTHSDDGKTVATDYFGASADSIENLCNEINEASTHFFNSLTHYKDCDLES